MANALKQCETPDFISYIARMYNNHVQHVKACTVGNMLSSAKQEYIALVTAKKWTVSLTNTAAVNVAGAGTKAAASVGTTTSDDTSSSLTLQDKSTHAPQTAGFAGLLSRSGFLKGQLVVPPWWRTSGLLLWFIGVFLAWRERFIGSSLPGGRPGFLLLFG
jgi:hypothetical protein